MGDAYRIGECFFPKDKSYGDSDTLGFNTARGIFIGIIEAATSPLTIGLYGPWGSGKTTMINGIVEQLQKDNYLTLVFDAWKYRHESNLVLPLMCALESSLSPAVCRDGEKNVVERVQYWCRARRKEFSLLGSLGLVLANQYINKEIGIDFDQADTAVKKKLLKQYERYEDNVKKIECEYSEFIRACLEEAKKRSGNRDINKVVFFIDNLDRCLPNIVISLLEDISSFLSIRGLPCIYVLAMDKENVIKAVNHRYPDFDGAHYLEKIVQVALKMPVPQQNNKGEGSAGRYHFMKRYEWGKMYEKDSHAGDSRDKVYKELAKVENIFDDDLLGNPRRMERIVNKLMLLEAARLFDVEKNPADVPALLFLLLLAEYFPVVYASLKNDSDFRCLRDFLQMSIQVQTSPFNKRKERESMPPQSKILNEGIFNAYCDDRKFFPFLKGFSNLAEVSDLQNRLQQIKSYLNCIG
ncbi:MAG: P-loop NTPase fold protein [Candidatus Omnitrophota bacterium]|jgi:hypothetical protein